MEPETPYKKIFGFLQGVYITAVARPHSRVQMNAQDIHILYHGYVGYSHADFVESNTICLRYITCVVIVNAFSLYNCSMPLDTHH